MPTWSGPDREQIGERGSRIFTRAESEYKTKLYINQLTASDAGTYTCQVGDRTTTFTLRLGGEISTI